MRRLGARRLLRSLTSPRAPALGAVAGVILIAAVTVAWPDEEPVAFNRDVRPILNDKCISCHGGVKRSGGFGVLFREDALAKTESGRYGIVPGDPDASEMIRRITHANEAERMPRDGTPLSPEEIETLRRWIAEGAKWEDHWAYIKPEASPLPEVSDDRWVRGGIDHFTLARLDAEGLEPSPVASCETLIRRVSLDLVGLPPAPEAVTDFCANASAEGYEKVVDGLLASPRFGEHWSAMWLDLARYADTKGYERDPHREIWRYRDWVIDAFNEDLPFDRFTLEQLAGDLMPAATDEQLLATAFHRNTMTNDEGGTSDEEFRVAAVLDRVNTVMEVWQGTTMGCVQCHSHPYDPFRHEDYYRLLAYFNNTADADWHNENPRLPVYGDTAEAKVRALLARLDSAGAPTRPRSSASLFAHTEKALYPRGRIGAASYAESKEVGGENEFISPMEDGAYARYAALDLTGVGSIVFGHRPGREPGFIEVRLGSRDGPLLAEVPVRRSGRRETEETVRVPIVPTDGRHDVYFILRKPEDAGYRIHWFSLYPSLGDPEKDQKILELQRELASVEPEGETPVLFELPPVQRRATHVFERGNWLLHGDTVQPGVPASLPALPAGAPANRLGLAQWMVSPENPLTARVAVNRFWARLFGTGIVETLEDFGTQGAAPSHPELLDYLALRFMNEHDWSMKALLKEIVISSTYRQSSHIDATRLERDPANRLLSRGPRVRLSAEQVRDQALAVSGLLSDRMHGPGVMPPQPPKLWDSPFDNRQWTTSPGEDRYRRAVYTYWKRTVPYPSIVAFDAPTRDLVVSRRIPTNTPLQALVTLNDPVYVEAAQALARLMLSDGAELDERLRSGYRRALATDPEPAILARLRSFYQASARSYQEQPELLEAAVRPYMPYDTAGGDARGAGGPDTLPTWASSPVADSVDLAALTAVASAILNLDGFLTKE